MTRLLFAVILLSGVSQANEINYQSFDGRWCGKWDKLYSLCIRLNDIKNNPIADYQWQEQTNSKFQQASKRITIVNQTTIKLENIFITLDKNNPNQAKAIGLFTQQTRYADLVKQED